MGVYIKGMEMPKSCVECDIGVGICNRYYDPKFDINDAHIKRHPDCPLVEVKAPHGRLGDLDALAHIIGQHSLNWEYGEGVNDCWDDTIKAPTIIEAEGKDDG